MKMLDRSIGRAAFGGDPANYHASRFPYPARLWQALRERAGLRPGIDILEIGAGTGLGTSGLLAARPLRLLAVEPDERLAGFLRSNTAGAPLAILAEPFETAALPATSFDLVASATAFHWLDQLPALAKVRRVLKRGGHLALWWNVYGDLERADPFHEATTHLFTGHAVSTAESTSGGPPFPLDEPARIADLTAAGFAPDPPEFVRSTMVLDPMGVRRLYNTYSNVTSLPPAEREALLGGLVDVAERQFGGRVERNIVTAIYTARPGAGG